jgi:hypothetical protein
MYEIPLEALMPAPFSLSLSFSVQNINNLPERRVPSPISTPVRRADVSLLASTLLSINSSNPSAIKTILNSFFQFIT